MKEIEWLGSSKKDLIKFPLEVVQEMGFALYCAQKGDHYHKAKPLRGLGSGVFELVIDFEKNAYRLIYLVGFGEALYVVHCFQKKSKTGIETPQEEMDLAKQRLKLLRNIK